MHILPAIVESTLVAVQWQAGCACAAYSVCIAYDWVSGHPKDREVDGGH
jgi:hypothetical protein